MAVHTSPESLLRAQVKRFASWSKALRSEHEALVRDSLGDAMELTSGAPAPKGSRARLKNRNRGLPIGTVTGRLKRGFYVRRVAYSGGQKFELLNRARHGRYILSPTGTKFLSPTGFDKALIRRASARQQLAVRRLRDTIRRSA